MDSPKSPSTRVDSSKQDSDITKFVGLGYEIVGTAIEQTLIDTNPISTTGVMRTGWTAAYGPSPLPAPTGASSST